MSELSPQELISRLPEWARRYFKEQQDRFKIANEEPIRLRMEIERLQKIIRELSDRNSAMLQIFQCAAKGESEVARAVMRILEDYLTCDSE